MILFLAFAAILTISFGVMAVVISSSKAQRLVARRVAGIRVAVNETNSSDALELLKIEPVTRFDWLNRLIHKYPISRMVEARILQSDSKTTPAMLRVATPRFVVLTQFLFF